MEAIVKQMRGEIDILLGVSPEYLAVLNELHQHLVEVVGLEPANLLLYLHTQELDAVLSLGLSQTNGQHNLLLQDGRHQMLVEQAGDVADRVLAIEEVVASIFDCPSEDNVVNTGRVIGFCAQIDGRKL